MTTQPIEKAPGATSQAQAPESATGTPKGRILVVDDDDEVRRGLRCVLIMEGYEVATATNGREGVEKFRNGPCDLALVDMNMPLQNGWSTIAALRSMRRGLPVIFITARPDQRTLARECNVDLMEKPLDLPKLLERITALVDASAGGATTQP
jgi:DNA-binding response OmpR family regulator